MSSKSDIIGETGLQFFGKVSASISHEIKNVLAIMNENAGLLEDYTHMLENGKPINTELFKTLAGKVLKQIQRADGIVKRLNRFAHSVDNFAMSVDLVEIVTFMVELSHRSASSRGVSLEPSASTGPVKITTNPFFLQSLIWLCLDFAMDMVDNGKTIGIITEEKERCAWIRFTHLKGLTGISIDEFPSEREKALLSLLKADLTVDVNAGEIVITWPEA